MSLAPEIKASAFSLSDGEGRERAKLSLIEQNPSLAFFDVYHQMRLQLGLSEGGLPQVFLFGKAAAEPTVKLECDPKGSHLLLRGEGGNQGYFFLKSDGGAGVVLFGAGGMRQIELLLPTEGVPRWTLWDREGNVVGASEPSQ